LRRGRGLWWDVAVFGGVKVKGKKEKKTCSFFEFFSFISCVSCRIFEVLGQKIDFRCRLA
jgi:hypothetical protein